MIVLAYFIYFGIPYLWNTILAIAGLTLSALEAGTICLALNCGAYTIKITGDPTDFTGALMGDFLPEGGSARELELINVMAHVTDTFPSAYIMTCDGDFLHDGAGPLSSLLRELGVMHELHIFGGLGEQLGHVFHCNMKSEDARRCNDDECRFFKRFL